ncbi:MAG: membrane protein of unknown function [Candidatus Thorarchaeota archaeon]|nr:MAG: membrane protein of unknown function [Candidatus Thorarchaeota archaeon]
MTKNIPAIILLFIAIAELSLVTVGLSSGSLAPAGIVPIFNLDSSITYLIFWIAIPLGGSILAVLIFPRILTPLFMIIKKVLRRGYNDGYVPMNISGFSTTRMIMRLVYVYLLVVGLLTTLLNLFDPQLFLTNDVFTSGINPLYNISYIFCIAGIATPITVALWSVGWALEDAGLIHYKLPPKESGQLYEIEPVYRSYSSYLKGFAGFSTILSLFVMYDYFMSVGLDFDAISVFLIPFHAMLVVIPAYVLFSAIGSNWLRKNKPALKQLEENEVELKS